MVNWKDDLKKVYGDIKEIFVLETNLDDVRGEILGNLFTILLANGALDVSIISTITKKNRPGYIINVICNEKDISKLIPLIIQNTGTLGVRIKQEHRICLHRKFEEKVVMIGDKEYKYNIKKSYDSTGHLINAKVEFDDIKAIADSEHQSIFEIEKRINNNQS